MTIKYAIVKNEMPASAEDAKYLGRAIPNGVRNRALMTANALKSEHFAEATFNAVIDAAIALTSELCAEGHDVDWGPVKFLAKMHGSLPYEDSSFTDGTASLSLNADATNATRATVGLLEPVKVSADEIASSIKVSNIMDVATEAFGTVVGATEFYVLGNGITLDGEGEYVKAFDKKTGEFKGTAQVISVSKGQRAKCKFDPQLAGGDYILEIATKGLIGETMPRVFRKSVVAVYVEPTDPVFTKATSAGCAEGTVKPNTMVTISGRHLNNLPEDVIITFHFPMEGGGDTPTAGSDVTIAPDGLSLTCEILDAPEGSVAGQGSVVADPGTGEAYITSTDVNYVLS